jgi:hypothetical protein
MARIIKSKEDLRMKRLLLVIGLVVLAGCIMDQKGKIDQKSDPPPPVNINVQPSKEQDLGEVRKGLSDLRTDIATSSNNTANQFSGLLNANVSKLAERLTGLEANLSELVKVTATMNNTANVDMKNKLEAALTAVANLKAELTAIMNTSVKMEAEFSAQATLLAKLDVAIGRLETTISATANGQVGFNNKFEQKMERVEEHLTAQAGRDVNMYPAAAVYTVLGVVGAFVLIVVIVAAVAMSVIINSYKASREREAGRTQNEKDERKRYERLLMKAISMIPEGKLNREISKEFGLADPGEQHA